jgi:predicted DNA-binding protein YlxM (UPF0122 family)
MTVKCVSPNRKILIAHQYIFLKLSLAEIATEHEVSIRTIQRVLKEQGVTIEKKTTRKVVLNMVPPMRSNEPVAEITHPLPNLTTMETVTLAIKCFVLRPLLKSLYVKPRNKY